MSDADKIKEAEESITKIASELKGMKNATDLLQGAEKKTDAVLNRAEQILQATQELTGKWGEVVKTLSDFNRHFGEVQAEYKRMAKESEKKTTDAVAALESNVKESINVSNRRLEEVQAENKRMAKESEKKTTDAVTALESNVRESINVSNRHFGEVQAENKRIEDGIERLINNVQIAARESRTRQYITMGFVIFSLVVALSIFIGLFVVTSGGA